MQSFPLTVDRFLDHAGAALRGKAPDGWLPDEIALIAAMPPAATGRIDKGRLRDDYAGGVGVDRHSDA